MPTRGIDIRQTSDRIVFRASLKDSAGAKVTSGTTELRVYRLEDDGTLDVLDWDSGVKDFVSSGATDDEVTMTHRQSNGTDDTGIWTYVLSDATLLAAFDSGQVYIAQVTNSGAVPESQEREFQFGGVEGDQAENSAGSGPQAVVITVTDGTDPLNNAEVSVRLNGVLKATGTTNTDGEFTANLPATGTYDVIASLDGYTQASAVTVNSATEATKSVTMTAIAISPSGDPAKTTLWGITLDQSGNAESGVTVTYELISPPPGAGYIYDNDIITLTSDGSGVVQSAAIKGAQYRITRESRFIDYKVPADAGASTQLESFL